MDGAQDSLSQPSGIKKVFSRQSRQDPEINSSSNRSNGRSSLESTPERRPATSGDQGQEDSSSRLSKLINNRRKKKNATNDKRAGSIASADSILESSTNSAGMSLRNEPSVSGSSPNGSNNALARSAGSVNLLTDDSEPDQIPPLLSRDSHAEYLTASSPLITTTAVDEDNDERKDASLLHSASSSRRHSISVPQASSAFLGTTISGPDAEISKKRSVSPARRLKDAFKPSQSKKSPSVSPDRESSQSTGSQRKNGQNLLGGPSRSNSLSERRSFKRSSSPPPPLPRTLSTNFIETSNPKVVDQADRLDAPSTTDASKVVTTVTPPTPTNISGEFSTGLTESPETVKSESADFPPGTVVSPSGHMISHRRVRSAGTVTNPPSKLSHMTSLTPTAEEPRGTSPRSPSAAQGGFFSSVFSAAQNAASTITNTLGAQNKNRTTSQAADLGKNATESANDASEDQTEATRQSVAEGIEQQKQKELAINTLGSGDLDFSHLDMDLTAGGIVTTKDGVVITQPDLPAESRTSAIAAKRDRESARVEDSRAARAVSLAYEKSSDPPSTTVASTSDEASDVKVRPSSMPFEGSGTQTPPGGSIFDGDTGGSIKRTGSVRSRLARRHRGSSGATGSTIGAIGLTVGSLGLPNNNSSVPRLTGFAVASKKRNRDYHQLFRSVPEDDFLIEDYSCALQRDIILAGRIYISEGHICFSSNILGWVTTLVISFDEIVAIEKENTAMVIPNAIAIQTLHARHTFRSLLSREATYDLMVNIWKINHPSLRSYLNGMRIDDGLGDKTEKANESDVASEVADEDEIYDEDEDNDGDSLVDGDVSINGSESVGTGKQLSRENTGLTSQRAESTTALQTADGKSNDKGVTNSTDGNGFPGPGTHPPTEYNDPAGRYDKVVKEDVIPAPLGKVYNLMLGPASGAFVSKFLVEDEKCTELQFEDDKKGLNEPSKTRQYSYIKPLNGAIGPKQTKCISTEQLDVLDLEKAVLATLTTQTPDVPSGNVFSVKTKYLLTWAPNNHTRFLMTCAIEWTGKSWLKGPIEKGAIDGQMTYGNDLVKSLKSAVNTRPAGTTKGAKSSKSRRKQSSAAATKSADVAAAVSAALDANKRDSQGWGIFEPIHSLLGPVISIFKPLWNAPVAIAIIAFLLFTLYTRGPNSSTTSSDLNFLRHASSQRLAAYEEIWRAEENELWRWLEDRVGMEGINFPNNNRSPNADAKARKRNLKRHGQSLASKIDEEQISQREMDYAIQVVRDRLDRLEEIVSTHQDRSRPSQT
ncbi:GRAM domain protein [Talaromyces stipitatus ATCC 10500]|uniref:GRAM domain protein n=1 Tax=Talaromyces stipitatus (strain ATCC 10500 / CBS 375.48 / QM 6759 / NRRL 1006) TaxID=441959 RepID=B8MR60_TALSN|nr:GRAM domain protein [Talaromyces stipitatus ATCC 10500]EED12955.1 GRAM domain protein [Talaromyces stipitatus ATCC 10500]